MTEKKVRRHPTTQSAAVLTLLLLQLFPLHLSVSQSDIGQQIAQLFKQDSVTILVTDSGLGGLSVCADLEAQFRKLKPFTKVRLIFVNALPGVTMTYNSMATKEEQASMFDRALAGFVRWYHPDAILIACNTLSAVYPETKFAQSTTIPVVSIIEVGARMIAERVKATPNSSALVFGTATTISSGMYHQKLGMLGVPKTDIATQPCPLLETEIQADPKSDLVGNLVEVYVGQAMENIGKPPAGTLVVGLCCSHYGYSIEAFDRSLRQNASLKYELVNPNKAMVSLFKDAAVKGKSPKTLTTVEVASRVRFTAQEVSSIARAVGSISQKTAQALKHYTFKEDLFRVQ